MQFVRLHHLFLFLGTIALSAFLLFAVLHLISHVDSPPKIDELSNRKEADFVFDLPGVTFEINFNHYAGYLKGNKGNLLHYWFFESQSSPERDPLLLWVPSEPGCSGHTSVFLGNGPFRPNRDGLTLSENVFSWNKDADELVAAIDDFFAVYPEYKHRPFFIGGESHGGALALSTASLLLDQVTISHLSFVNFKGVVAGNTLLSSHHQFNAGIQYNYFHGDIGKDEYDSLQECCPHQSHPGNKGYFEFCDFTTYIEFDRHGNPHPNKSCATEICAKCAELTINITRANSAQNPYNLYQSCYELPNFSNDRRELVQPYYAKTGFVDQARLVSHESSDSQDGLSCWGPIAMRTYLNTPVVQDALHVNARGDGQTMEWKGCKRVTGDVVENDEEQYSDMRPFFDKIIEKNISFKFLIYNGDLDPSNNFIAAQWFTERIVNDYRMKTDRSYSAWRYLGVIGGYAETFSHRNTTIDLVTVKGAGHFCSLDRPGPTLQVLSSFFHDQPLETETQADLKLAALKERYIVEEMVGRQRALAHAIPDDETRGKRNVDEKLPPSPPKCSKQNDKVETLPGLTFDFTTNHYSGYLNAGDGSYLHYWLVEAEKSPDTAPLILWFNGGPGSSSLTGLLKEIGPFLNNLDGETLYENVFSWHKLANILYIESPRDVGFSFQASDSDAETVHKYDDNMTAADNLRALIDFLECFPGYKQRRLFIAGQSYAAVYVPMLVDLLLTKIIENEVEDVNLEGIIIGNGYFSGHQSINSAASLTYFRGFHSKKEYESLARCIPDDYNGTMAHFDWSQFVEINEHGLTKRRVNDTTTLEGFCGAEVARQAVKDVWRSELNVYNTYQDCYKRNAVLTPGGRNSSSKHSKRDLKGRPMPFINEAKRFNYLSTDNNGGLNCASPIGVYLNRPDVRKTIHIPDTFTAKWLGYSKAIDHEYYQQLHNDTTQIFENILTSAEKLNKRLRLIFYHGDADMACQFLSGQWFTENLAKKMQIAVKRKFSPWIYEQTNYTAQGSLGGYVKSFEYNNLVSIDLITIKGAGHMVPVDRPGPILQTMHNFINNVDYNTPLWKAISLDRKPLKHEFMGFPDKMRNVSDSS